MESFPNIPSPQEAQTPSSYEEWDVRGHLSRFENMPYVRETIVRYLQIIEEAVCPKGVTLRTVTANITNGVSVYAHYGIIGSDKEINKKVKVRISNHKAKGNSSHSNLDLRNPSDAETLIKFLKSLV